MAGDTSRGGLIRDGVRGKYAADFAASTSLVLLDRDLAREFPNAAAVNDALREYLTRRKK
jgi:hypothetical protein